MAITISGSGITSANIADGTIVNEDVADLAASKLTGALPAIDGSALTGLPAAGADTSLSNLSATGEQRVCHAWVNFNGTGTVAIRDSYNVSSITDDGTGDYTVNLSITMSNTNYAVPSNGGSKILACSSWPASTSAFNYESFDTRNWDWVDAPECSAAVFGD